MKKILVALLLIAVLFIGGCVGSGTINGASAESEWFTIDGSDFKLTDIQWMNENNQHKDYLCGDIRGEYCWARDTVTVIAYFKPAPTPKSSKSEDLLHYLCEYGGWDKPRNFWGKGEEYIDIDAFNVCNGVNVKICCRLVNKNGIYKSNEYCDIITIGPLCDSR